jgi:hypothetical protein
VVRKDSVWQEIAASVYAQCKEGRSAIAFVEGRAYAEKLAYYVNQIGGEGFARTHHGSLSKEQRFQVENELRSGRLRLLCATSSMELGIDVGDYRPGLSGGAAPAPSQALCRGWEERGITQTEQASCTSSQGCPWRGSTAG